jgi:predicted nucleotidyltransferase
LREKGIKARVAEEAAKLIYYNLAADYKRAKEEACRHLGVKVFPSNFEVAEELDRLADEVEGKSRKCLNIRLRKEGLSLMRHLKDFSPRLIGGVWRGTARKGSDIDITVYSHSIKSILSFIGERYRISKAEYSYKTTGGKTERYFHIYISLPSGDEAEVVVRDLRERSEKSRCEIYGDYVTGLTIEQLQKVLEGDPTEKFIPKR